MSTLRKIFILLGIAGLAFVFLFPLKFANSPVSSGARSQSPAVIERDFLFGKNTIDIVYFTDTRQWVSLPPLEHSVKVTENAKDMTPGAKKRNIEWLEKVHQQKHRVPFNVDTNRMALECFAVIVLCGLAVLATIILSKR